MSRRRVTAVLVQRDDAATVGAVLAELAAAGAELARDDRLPIDALDVVLVDRGSTDGTVAAARRAADRLGLVLTVVERAGVDGWTATADGLVRAVRATPRPTLLVTLDGQHDARQIAGLIAHREARSSGVVIGSRWVSGGGAPATPLPRRIVSRVASRLVGWVTGAGGTRDATTAFRVLHPDVVDLVVGERTAVGTYAAHAELVAAARAYGFEVAEAPITFRPRHARPDRLHATDLVRFARDLPLVRGRVHRIRATMRSDQTLWASRSGRLRAQARTGPELADFGALEELATLAEASNFTEWIVDQFSPAVARAGGADAGAVHVVEVGAGLGAVARRLVERHPNVTVTALEPAGNVVERLRTANAEQPRVTVVRATSDDHLAAGHAGAADVVLYVNVLEHVRDDAAELRVAHDLLRPGGTLGLFVPALPRLYGSLDHKSGHYRRYRRDQLRTIVDAAGFDVERLHHLDLLGVAPYFVLYRLARVGRLDRASSGLYDRVVVPVGRLLERCSGAPPVGKNLVVVARRRA